MFYRGLIRRFLQLHGFAYYETDDKIEFAYNDHNYIVYSQNSIERDGIGISDTEFEMFLYIGRCYYCGEYFFNDELSYDDNEHLLCSHCFDTTVCCCCCGELLTPNDGYELNNGDIYCPNCYDELPTCDICGEVCSITYSTYYDGHFITSCSYCANNFNYCGIHNLYYDGVKCPLCKPITKLYNCSTVLRYHPQVPITPIDNYRQIKQIDTFKGYGIELEINKDETRELYQPFEMANLCNKYLKGKAYYTEDGSLRNGFEIVTQPITPLAFTKIKWNNLFKDLLKNNFTKHSKCAGYHIHISKTLLGDTDNEIYDNIAKLIYFFEKNSKDLIKISGRTTDNMRWCEFYTRCNVVYIPYDVRDDFIKSKMVTADSVRFKNVSQTDAKWLCDKHLMRGALNTRCLKSTNTIEVRLFASTLDYDEFVARFEFVKGLIDVVKDINWTDIDVKENWTKKMSENALNYLKKYKVLGVK